MNAAFDARGLRNEPPLQSHRMSIECHNDQQVVDRIRLVLSRAQKDVAKIIAEEIVNDVETLFPMSLMAEKIENTLLWELDRYHEALELVDQERGR